MKSGHDGSLRGSEEEEKTSGKNWGGANKNSKAEENVEGHRGGK